jgi:hypothetical protein
MGRAAATTTDGTGLAAHLATNVPVVPSDASVAGVLAALTGRRFAARAAVADAAGRFLLAPALGHHPLRTGRPPDGGTFARGAGAAPAVAWTWRKDGRHDTTQSAAVART